MEKSYPYILLLAAMVIFSGCSSSPGIGGVQKDPKELFKELALKSLIPPNGRYDYNIKLNLSNLEPEMPSFLSNMNVDTSIYNFNGRTKTSMTMTVMGMTATASIYNNNGSIVTCSEVAGLSGMKCVRGESGSAATLNNFNGQQFNELFQKNADKLPDISLAEKQYGGRGCYDFSISLDGSDFQKLAQSDPDMNIPSSYYSDSQVKYNVCLDKQYGFACLVDMKFINVSRQPDPVTMSMRMELKRFDPAGATASDVTAPQISE